MSYKVDILISFAEADNQPSENGTGWVSDFKGFLELMMEQVLGEKPNIIMKADSDTITVSDLNQVATLIPIMSSEFVNSGNCLDTLEEFGRICENDSFPRIFKVHKSLVPLENQPKRVRALIGYELFMYDSETGNSTEFSDYFNQDATNNYWMPIVDISFDIHDCLYQLTGKGSLVKSINERKTVYVAETAHDLIIQRNIIKRELQRHGYKVLPDQALPKESGALERAIEDYLGKSDLAIHLIRNSYGDIPQGTEKSVVDIQNFLAGNKAKNASADEFSRLIWISPNQRTSSEKQKTFIENVKRDTDASKNAEILQTPLEDFKNVIRTEIIDGGITRKTAEDKKSSNAMTDNSVYLIHDKADRTEADKIKKELESSGINVLTPLFEGDLLTVRENHIQNLRNFDGAIVFQKNVNRQWVKMKVLDLLKAPGFGRNKKIRAKAVISNDFTGLESYTEQGIELIENNGSLKSQLEGLIENIKSN